MMETGPIANDLTSREVLNFRLDHVAMRRTFDLLVEHAMATSPTLARPQIGPREQSVVDRLEDDGFLPHQMLTESEAADVVSYLSAQPVFDGHYPTHSTGRKFNDYTQPVGINYTHYPTEVLLNAPHIRARIIENRFIHRVAEGYLKFSPKLYSLGCFWSYPAKTQHPFSQLWHRDWDDFKFISAFMYLTDIRTVADGPHKFIKGSQRPEAPQELLYVIAQRRRRLRYRLKGALCSLRAGLRIADGHFGRIIPQINVNEYLYQRSKLNPVYSEILRDQVETVYGQKGSGFLVDVGGYHMGILPRSKPRLLFWMRYGISQDAIEV